jgi:hypothetical protein
VSKSGVTLNSTIIRPIDTFNPDPLEIKGILVTEQEIVFRDECELVAEGLQNLKEIPGLERARVLIRCQGYCVDDQGPPMELRIQSWIDV